MRKILSIFFLSIMLLSCGDDEEKEIPRPHTIDKNILGKWELESCMRISSAKFDEESGKYVYDEKDVNYNSYGLFSFNENRIEIKGDNTIKSYGLSDGKPYSETIFYKIEDSYMKFTILGKGYFPNYESADFLLSCIYTLNSNKLTIETMKRHDVFYNNFYIKTIYNKVDRFPYIYS